MRFVASALLLIATGACAAQVGVPETTVGSRILAAGEEKLASGIALRKRYNLPTYEQSPSIHIDWSNKHHVELESSVILYKDASGHWQRDDATEARSGLLTVEPHLENHTVTAVPSSDEQKLEMLIRDRKTYVAQAAPSLREIADGFAGIEVRSRHGAVKTISYPAQSGPIADIRKIGAGS